MNKKNLIIGAGVLVLGIIVWSIFSSHQSVAGSSPSGSTFNTAKFAGIVMNLATPGTNGTTSSILNTDANDRYLTSITEDCEGVGTSKEAYDGAGLPALKLTVSTTTTAVPLQPASIFAAPVLNGAVATTSNWLVNSTSTNPSGYATGSTASTSIADVWLAGSYLTFWWNATNTAVCTVGAHYNAS